MKGLKWKTFLIITDILSVILSLYFSYVLRFEGAIPAKYIASIKMTIIPVAFLTIIIFYIFRLYDRIWRYASINEMISIILANILATSLTVCYTKITKNLYPRSVYVLYCLLLTTMSGGVRFIFRICKDKIGFRKRNDNKNIMIIGAGAAGTIVVREFVKHPELKMRPVAIIDDDETKHGLQIHGVKVEGNRNKIPEIVLKYNVKEILIAMPAVDRREIKDIVDICRKTKCKIKILPGVYEILNGKVNVNRIRDVKIEDLLGREPVKVNLDEISGYIKNKVVLVTGGGGSIGSELCRQMAKFHPKKLLIFDISENGVYDLEFDLKTYFPDVKYEAIIGSVRDRDKLVSVFSKYRPQVVFHAAAHKHVPLMELNPVEAIKNNVFGTLNTAEVAAEFNVERFTLISTDKAVNPTNVMGASKRIAEIIIQMLAKKSKTVFSAVRFGNVLGSRGSVVPLFKKQIAKGGPITVTHPEVTRYFMTIPEAVQLVIQAGAMAKGGEIFILDMGEPVKIAELAKEMIHLSGLEPDVDIKIEYTGLRPGEKLYEELLLNEEDLKTTKNKKIFIAKPTIVDAKQFKKELNNLKDVILGKNKDLDNIIKTLIPTYRELLGEKGKKVSWGK